MNIIEYDPQTGAVLSLISVIEDQDMPAGITNYIIVDDNFPTDFLSDWEIQNGIAVQTAIVSEREDAKTLVDQKIGETRLLFITEIAGQNMTYQRKEEQARSYVADPILAELNISQYPFITKEASATGLTNAQVAANVITQADGWVSLGSDIEAIRIGSKMELEAATTSIDIETALNDFQTDIANLLAAQ